MILKTKQKCLGKFESIIFYKIMKSIFARGIEDICDKNGGGGDYSDIREQVFKILGGV